MTFNRKTWHSTQLSLGGLAAAGTLVCLFTVAGFGSALAWPLDLVVHFRAQYAVVLVLLAGGFALRKAIIPTSLFALGACLNLAVLAPYLIPGAVPGDPDQKRMRFMLLNVHTANRATETVLTAIRREAPDILVLEEVNDRWLRALEPLGELFPHALTVPREDNFGIALFSRRPLEEPEVLDLGAPGVPSLRVRLRLAGMPLTVLVTHPVPPGDPQHYHWRNGQLRAVAQTAAGEKGAVVVMGDLNTTPWSAHFRRVLREGNLRDTGRGQGLRGTWPAWCWPLRIPLDHCLVSRQLEVADRRVGAAVGSDHLPLVVDLQAAGNARSP